MGKANDKDTSPELVSALRDLQTQLMILGGTKGALIRAPSPYRPTATRAEAAPADDKSEKPAGGRRQRSQRQQQAVRGVLPKLTDRDGTVLYPDGKVPNSVGTETVLQQIIVALGYDVNWNGWHTVNRALDRE